MKLTITLDLSDIQIASIARLMTDYPHGWHTADLIVRRDARERRFEADWAMDVSRAVRTALGAS